MTTRKVLSDGDADRTVIQYPDPSDIRPLTGEDIIVCVTQERWNRNDFCTQMSVRGTLETHPKGEQCRVLSSNDTYTYFDLSEVTAMGRKQTDNTMVFYIEFETITVNKPSALDILFDEIERQTS